MVEQSNWTDLLRAHLAAVRARAPIPARESLSPSDEERCRILGGHLISWLSRWGPRLLRERNAIPRLRGDTSEPLIVFVTDTPGLVASAEILGSEQTRVVACRRSEYESFPGLAEDEEFKVHIELHSYFEEPPTQAAEADLRRKYEVTGKGQLWIHYDCSVLGKLFARGARHLWHWDGERPQLIEEAFDRWIS